MPTMSNCRARRLLPLASVLALSMGGAAHAQSTTVTDGPTTADEAPQTTTEQVLQSPGGIDDIIVTARRKEENLQRVPTSIGVLDSEDLVARDIASFQDLRASVANLSTVRTTTAGGGYLTIRGQSGLSTPNIALDSQIGLYIDGVYLGRAQSSGGDLADIERVEVLRGPQGTLFGRNSTAGAVNFITGAPTGEASADGQITVGNFDRFGARVTLNSPRIGGFSFRVTYQHDENSGDVRNLAAGTRLNYGAGFGEVVAPATFGARNSDVVVAKARFDGVDGLTVDYKFDYSLTLDTPLITQAVGFIPTAAGAQGANLFTRQLPGAVILGFEKRRVVNQDGNGTARLRAYGHLLNIAYEISDTTTIKSISAYRDLATRGPLDLDLGVFTQPLANGGRIPLGLLHALNSIKQDQFSQEVQLLGSYDSLDYILGGFFFREDGQQNQLQGSLPLVPGADGVIPVPQSAINQRDTTDNKAYAVYGHVDVRPADGLEIALGVRYTIDRRETVDARTATPVIGRVRDERLTYDAAVTYTVVPDVNLYARYARGYVAGGFARGFSYGPETVDSYEIGLKSDLLNRRLRFNAAAFKTNVRNRQTTQFVPGVGVVFFNIGEVDIKGFELEATAVPVDGLTLTANVGYSDPEFSDGSRSVVPERNVALSAQYDTQPLFDDAFLSFRIDADYRSAYFSNNLNTFAGRNASVPLPPAVYAGFPNQNAYRDTVIDALTGGDYWLANARISLSDIDLGAGRFRVSAFARNLFNKRGATFVIDYGVIAGASYEFERTVGLELGFRF